MNNFKLQVNCVSTRKILVLAMMAAFGPAQADETVEELIKPDTASISVGIAGATGSREDRSFFGQYNGWGDSNSAALLDFEYVRRDDVTGTWTKAEGFNLGLDNRELQFSRDVQGQWKIAGEYSEQVRHDPLTLTTGMQGVGTTTPAASLVGLGAGANVNLELKRAAFSVSGLKWLSPNLSVEANFKTEDKDGARLSGIGGYCSNAISPICNGAATTVAALFLLPEPVNSTTRQIEGNIHYVNDKLSLSGGYYGSFFNNSNNTVALGGVGAVLGAGSTQTALAANLALPVALPPDNQAHQFYLSGTYALQPTTRVNFKVAYTHATQNQSFGSLGAGSHDGAVNTTMGQAGLTMRPIKNLTLNLSGRVEDKKDNTRLGNYVVDGAGNLYTNSPTNSLRASGKAEALYQFSGKYRGLLAVDYAYVNRDRPVSTTWIPATSMAALRERTNEVGVRAELRGSISETVSGSVGVGHSERDGYRWYSLDPVTGYPFMSYGASNGLSGTFPMTMVDRSRDNIKLMADWAPTQALSIQLALDQGTDRFKGPTSAGLNKTDTFSFNVDASYKLNLKWALTGYASSGKQTLGMRQQIGYIADLENRSNTVGFGATGKINSQLEIGGNLSYQEDINRYNIGMTTSAAVTNPPPDETYRSTVLKLYAKYALDKASGIQVDLVHQRVGYDQWAWGNGGIPFAYTDNSTVTVQPDQQVTYLGVKYVYRFK
jgi:MtrB/PioB family decaheme-associated outer membrane protein